MNEPNRNLQLSSLVDLTKPKSALNDAKELFRFSFPASDFAIVERAFSFTRMLYNGHFPGYRQCAMEYHNYFHTLTVFSTASRLIDGCILSGMKLESEDASDILISSLLHDVGYLQKSEDVLGTGAKNTRIHVDLSSAFAIQQSTAFGFSPERGSRVGRLILGTDLGKEWDTLGFRDELESRAAKILAAADILGQMADRAYLEKLLFLYHEFREAGFEGYLTAFDILKKTASFYESIKARLDDTLGEVSHHSLEHFTKRFGIERDLYREAIERHMAYLRSILDDDTVNFRKKLKRLDLNAIEGDLKTG